MSDQKPQERTMKGSVKMYKKGKNWAAVFTDSDRRPDRKTRTLGTSRKSIAEAKMKEWEELWVNGDFDPWAGGLIREELSLRGAVETFLQERSHLRPKSITAYRWAMKGLEERLPPGMMLRSLGSEHVRPFVQDQTVSAETRRHRLRHLRAIIRWALKRKHITRNPLEEIELPKAEKKVAQFLTPEQLERVLAAIDADIELKRQEGQVMPGEIVWLKDLIIIAVGTGLRLGELCSLRWNGIDLESEFLTVRNTADFRTKSGHERRVPLAGDALEVVRRLHAARPDDLDGPVLTGYEGRPLAPNYASKRFKYYVRLARLPEHIRFHSLRHTCASWLVMRGVSLPIVQAILGHSSIQVTERYAHLAPDVVKAAMRQAFGGN